MKTTIMTPAHPQWTEFCNRSDLRDNKTFARTILAAMDTAKPINPSCEFAEEHRVYCDCEILFNVEDLGGW